MARMLLCFSFKTSVFRLNCSVGTLQKLSGSWVAVWALVSKRLTITNTHQALGTLPGI